MFFYSEWSDYNSVIGQLIKSYSEWSPELLRSLF